MSASSDRIFGGTRGTNPLKFDRKAAPIAMTPVRRALIAKVKIAQKELDLIDRDYRQILFDETGVTSAAQASEAGLVKVIERFKARGWQPRLADGRKAPPRRADHPGAGKARALMISLHQLGEIDDASEPALEAFAARQLKCDRLQWANQGQVFKLIEALKAMAERAGWDQSLRGVVPAMTVLTLKRRLVRRQLAILVEAGFAPPEWDVARAARAFGAGEIRSELLASDSQLDQVAQSLGRAIRQSRAAGACK